jgi:hypothetical protein
MLLAPNGVLVKEAAMLTNKDLTALGLSHPPEERSAWLRLYGLSHPEALKIVPAMLQLLPPAAEEPLERFKLYRAMARQFGHRQMASSGWIPPEDVYAVAQRLPDARDALLALVMLVRILASRDGFISPAWSQLIAQSGGIIIGAFEENSENMAWYIAHPEIRLVDKIDIVERICTLGARSGNALAFGRLLLYQDAKFDRWGADIRRRLWVVCLSHLTPREASILVDLAHVLERSVPDALAECALRRPGAQSPETFINTATIRRWILTPEEVAQPTL